MNKLVNLKIHTFILFVAAGVLVGCNKDGKDKNQIIRVSNDLDFPRKEVVEIKDGMLNDFLEDHSPETLRLRKKGDSTYLRTQWLDLNGDNKPEAWLFTAEVLENSSTAYEVVIDSLTSEPESQMVAYSRFVPERTDDYTWENDKVAFRTYGPEAQRLVEEGEQGGTLSSGIDLWFKSVPYSVIDEWYSKNEDSAGYYHIDHGEGYDPYHVGASRGTGGSGIWKEDSLYVSRNFTNYKTIAKGPLRTVLELEYEPWSEYGIRETKRISLDLGSNFSKFEVCLDSEEEIPNYTIGISLHDNEGEVRMDKEEGWFRHWEIIDSSYVGEGLVLDPNVLDSAFAHESGTPDQRNLLVITQPLNKQITYYAGFGWAKRENFEDVKDWDEHLRRFAASLENPLRVTIEPEDSNLR